MEICPIGTHTTTSYIYKYYPTRVVQYLSPNKDTLPSRFGIFLYTRLHSELKEYFGMFLFASLRYASLMSFL